MGGTPPADEAQVGGAIDQQELDQLLLINGFLSDDATEGRGKSLVDEIKDAVLDSGKLSLKEWRALRDRLKEIERMIPHIDLIIDLKSSRRGLVTPEAAKPVRRREGANP